MPDPILVLALLGSLLILAGYLRLIVDDRGNVPLLEYRLTGCLGAVVTGMLVGTGDLLRRRRTREASSTLMICAGLGAFAIAFGRGG